MPGLDRTGPLGQGPFTGRGRGQGFNQPVKCICPSCGYQEAKKPGVPCSTIVCPKCNSRMISS